MATKGLEKYKYFIEVDGEYTELGTLENVTTEREEVQRHYIADEALGGIEREYVEVDREADVGDYVMSKWSEKIYTVTEVSDAHALITTPEQLGHPNGFYYGSYKTLSPTNVIRLADGKRYEIADRKAEVGEKVMYIINGKSDGIVTTVTDVGVQYVDVEEYVSGKGDTVCAIDHIAYFVLVPVKDEAPAAYVSEKGVEAPKDAQALIANLAKEVAQLKRESATHYATQKVSEEVNDLAERIQRNFNEISEKVDVLERRIEDNGFAIVDEQQDIGRLEDAVVQIQEQVDSNTKDIRTWAEDYEETKAKVKTIDSYQDETIDRINGLEDLTEMLTCDIVTLDERTQDVPVFDKSSIKTFNPEDLNGKDVRIYSATDFDGSVKSTATIAVDSEGMSYLIDVRTEEVE